MFSEYASKFLAQSQTRMSAIREGRLIQPQPQAPLFHSAADFLPEHEQEVQDFYALQSSRRHFGAYAPSSAHGDDDSSEHDSEDEDSTHSLRRSRGKGARARLLGSSNIRSSWRAPERSTSRSGSVFSDNTERGNSSEGKGKGKMVDIGLDDSSSLGMMPDDIDHSDMIEESLPRPFGARARRDSSTDDEAHHPPDDITMEAPGDASPPPFQQFKRPPREPSSALPFASREEPKRDSFMPRESTADGGARSSRGPHMSTIPQQVYHPRLEPPAHDHIWGTVYIIMMACMFATSFVVWLHTEQPKKVFTPDTIYKILHSSMHLLTIDTVVALAVSFIWMYLLRSFVKPIVYFLIVSVPIALVALSIYPFVNSFKTAESGGGTRAQSLAMRWGSLAPAVMAVTWVYMAWKSRNAMQRAVGIIQLACRILGENTALFLLSFGTLVVTCVFSWIWIGMFTRAFLTGNFLVRSEWFWALNPKTVALGIYYIMMYLWTLGVSAGIHRATSAATVSQWYFYRHAIPTPSSKAVMSAALHHSTSTLFGTICLSSFLAVLIRLPLLLAPRRIAGFIHLFCFNFISSPIAATTNPLALTYAAIHSQPLIVSARALSNLRIIDTVGYGYDAGRGAPRTAYRLARMLLTAARGITALSLGFGAWVAAARYVSGGSAYGYVVGGVAGCIGYAVLGATEGCLSNIVDATLVCVGSEAGPESHCREAQMVFGG